MFRRFLGLALAASGGFAASASSLAHGHQHAELAHHETEQHHSLVGSEPLPGTVAIEGSHDTDHAHPQTVAVRAPRGELPLFVTAASIDLSVAPETRHRIFGVAERNVPSARSTGPPPRLRAPPRTA